MQKFSFLACLEVAEKLWVISMSNLNPDYLELRKFCCVFLFFRASLKNFGFSPKTNPFLSFFDMLSQIGNAQLNVFCTVLVALSGVEVGLG